jgi:hypothetical protein
MGFWKQNKKHGSGSQIWRRTDHLENETYQNSYITAFVGWFNEDEFDVGMFYEDGDDDSITLYYGKFLNGMKNDDEGFFYHNSADETYIVICKIENDKVIEGIKFVFTAIENKNLKFSNFICFAFKTEIHENTLEGEEKDMNENIKKQFSKAEQFIKLLFKDEDFGNIYTAAKEAEKAYKGIDTIEDFNNQFATMLKYFCKEGTIKIDDKLRNEFIKEGKLEFPWKYEK